MPYTREEAQTFGQLGLEVFLKRNRELLASFPGNDQVIRALVAWTRLHRQDELLNHLTTSETDLNFFANHLEEGFLTLYDAGKLSPVALITDLGQSSLDAMRKRTGIYPAGQSAPVPAPKPLSADELLEQEVRNDFATLRSDKMREKRRNDRRYEAMYQKIADTLGTLTTAYHDGSGDAR